MSRTGSAVVLAVVGHTNTGKTSLLRTLLRDEHFGEVADAPGTTRHVESARLQDRAGHTQLILRDTPGLEDAMGVLDYLDVLGAGARRHDGPSRIHRLLDSPEAKGRFEQECRVLQAVQQSDAALYVIDTRDPVLPKHQDELSLLAACARPVLPILNFTGNPQASPQSWRDALAGLGLHVSVDFDSVSPALDGPDQLFERLALLLASRAATLQALRRDLQAQREERRQDALRLIADLLVDTAALRLTCTPGAEAETATTRDLRQRTRQRETTCVQSLLARYRFRRETYPRHPLPLEGERWGMDLFNPQTLKRFGVDLGKGMATGAMAGATIDVLTGGLSLGAAALIGATAGGVWQGANQWGKRLLGRLTGERELTIAEPVLQLLALRQLALVRALEQRGHAATQAIRTDTTQATIPPGAQGAARTPPHEPAQISGTRPQLDALLALLNEARGEPAWSSIGPAPAPDSGREALVTELTTALTPLLEGPGAPAQQGNG